MTRPEYAFLLCRTGRRDGYDLQMVIEDNHSGRYEIDGSYTFSNLDSQTVLDDIYPELIEGFEDTFEEAEIQAYQEGYAD